MKIFLIILTCLIVLFFYLSFQDLSKSSITPIKCGEVTKVEYLQGNLGSYPKTIIYFMDGSNLILEGIYSIPKKNISIYKYHIGAAIPQYQFK